MSERLSAADAVRLVVLKASVTLCMRAPFLATALLSLPVKTVSAGIGTAATDGYRIYISSEFAASLESAEIQGLLAHELLHAVFQYPARRKWRDPKLWNVACDYAVNALLLQFGFSLPAGGLCPLERFANLSAEAIYDYLQHPEQPVRYGRHVRSISEPLMSRNSRVSPFPGIIPIVCCSKAVSSEDRGVNNSASGSKGNAKDNGERSGESSSKGYGNASGDLIDPASAAVFGREPSDTDSASIAEIASRLKRDLVLGAKTAGVLPGKTSEEIAASDRREVDWRVLMLQYMTKIIKTDWRLFPPSKRFVSQGIYLPSCGEPALGRFVFAIDTSGSMSQRDIAQILGELEGFRETFRCSLTVV